MLNAVVKSLGAFLEPEDLKRAREAYSLATTYICFNEAEFSHVQPGRLAKRLAHLVIRLVREAEEDAPESLSTRALDVLREANLEERRPFAA
jgi:hypothetical protein